MNQMGQQQPADPTALLNKCREINDGIADLRAKREGQLASAQNGLLDANTAKEDQVAHQGLDLIEDEVNNGFRYLRDLLKKVKQTPGSGDSRVQTQLDVTSRNLRREIEHYQRSQSDFKKRLREQVRRRYEIANPEATPEELDQGVDNVLMGQEQTFQVGDPIGTAFHIRDGPTNRYRSTALAPVKPTMLAKPPWNDRPPFARSSRI